MVGKYRRPKKIVILGTLDTKGEEHFFLKKRIAERGVQTIVVDTGIMDPPHFPPDIVAGAGIGITAKFAEIGGRI
ncbi:MAG: Tm-1-like ATP-binding domain-containing protein [Proteobacteria bacterium]|nr:Tm-1-like ATP-binding domain-containing protein [Pseudomonadota bacterium]